MSTSPLRIAFAGTPDFAAASLQALIDGPHDIAAVLTQPDRGAGRGKKVVQSPVKKLALAHDLPVLQPESLKDDEIQRRIADLNLDALIVVAYGLIIPRAVLALPRLACVNVHGSLLPRWRGAAPIQWAILAGDTETGNTIMKMDAGLDTGPMLLSEALPIGDRETGGELHDRLAAQGARLLSTVLDDLPGHLDRAEPQPEDGVTYASKLSKAGARLDFGLPARASPTGCAPSTPGRWPGWSWTASRCASGTRTRPPRPATARPSRAASSR
ncbi:Methionyl-tRNA formyltransferase [Alcanivorax sp. ALC70]|nr:Methionyl-tRNA formyltransferase [Alcanivorax sp. ALC70]